MSEILFTTLFRKYLDGSMTPEEHRIFQSMLSENRYSELLDRLLKPLAEEDHQQFAAGGPADPDLLFNRILGSEAAPSPSKPGILRPAWKNRWWMAAAAVLVLAFSATWYTLFRPAVSSPVLTAGRDIKLSRDVPPGKTGALLTLSDGTIIRLDSLSNGLVATQQGARITLQNGQLGYAAVQAGGGAKAGEAAPAPGMNTLSTPRGRHFSLVLPDGTKVWLNAASSITYPALFSGAERKVSIEGEAYFEVAKNKDKPFRVYSGQQVVEVLGTAFNINTYSNEAFIRTSLLQGGVRVIAPGGNRREPVLLKPQEQLSIARSDGSRSVAVIEDDQAIAWKNGYFYFQHADIRAVMRELERWYDIEVVFKGNSTSGSFEGKMEKNLSLADMLFGLQRTDIHFNIEGRTLTILP